jgi:PAS domain S-box-containing protein
VWGGREFTHDDESILVLLAEMAATAVDTARLYELAQTRGERLRAVLNASPLAIVELDDAGEATRWNDAALATFGWRPGDGDGHERRVFHETTASRFAPLVESARDGRPSLNVELTALRSDGNEVELSVSTAPLRAADRSVAGVLVVAADITDRRHLELQLHQAQRMEAMGRLAGGVAHDFNNMLTVILGYSEFLLRQLPEGAPMRAEIESIKSAGDRAARLTEQLLTISRRRVVQPIVVDVNDAVRSIEALLRRLIGEDVHLRTELDPDAGRVRIDPGQLDQVILNLVINARDAMPTGGDLVIETAAADEDGPGVVISIVDTGVGMDEQALEHCFEPFFSTKDRGKGTGLGLSTVYGIVTQAGGTVVAESTPGQGTAIRIFLPRVDEEVEAEGTAAPTPVYQHVGTVLLAEDEPQVRAIACEVLAGAGYSVVEAPDGLAALELARSGDVAFDVLVTDVVMPGMHGADLAAAIVDLQPETGVLFISGYADQGIGGWRRGDARGKFLAKPFQPDDLVRSVHELMEERRPQGSKR